jgi:hypothetical protein
LAEARITLRVAPGSATSAVVGRYGDGWKLRIAAAPERGKANDVLVRFLADVLAIPSHRVAVVAGHSSRTKVIEVDGLSLEAVNDALARATRSS